jgi:hypothetical protein
MSLRNRLNDDTLSSMLTCSMPFGQ